jgi:hypothetical protein
LIGNTIRLLTGQEKNACKNDPVKIFHDINFSYTLLKVVFHKLPSWPGGEFFEFPNTGS